MTTSELAEAGLGKKALRRLVESGELLPLRRGVYAVAELAKTLPGTAERRDRTLMAAGAVAVAGAAAVVSHQDAALLHGLALLDRPPGVITVCQPGTADRLLGGPVAVRIRGTQLAEGHVTSRNGVPVTSVARTVVDLARTTPYRSGVVTADCALHLGKTTKAELNAVIATCGRWPGVMRAQRVVEFSDGRAESPFESIARVAFRDGGLPPPELQVWVGGDSGRVGRADFLWRHHRTVAEADGALKYADPDRARQQLRRDADLREAGFEVVHFGWAELTLTPGQVIRAVRAAFARAGRLRLAG